MAKAKANAEEPIEPEVTEVCGRDNITFMMTPDQQEIIRDFCVVKSKRKKLEEYQPYEICEMLDKAIDYILGIIEQREELERIVKANTPKNYNKMNKLGVTVD